MAVGLGRNVTSERTAATRRDSGPRHRRLALRPIAQRPGRSHDGEVGLQIPGVTDWRSFEEYARQYFSKIWGTTLDARSVQVGGAVPWRFDLVSEDHQVVGDAKYLKNIAVPAAKWQGIAEYVWLLQQVPAKRVFLAFGNDVEVIDRYLRRVRPLTRPLEFYYLDGSGHRLL